MTADLLRRAAATTLGLAVPALLLAALWAWEWRYAATALVVGITSVAIMPTRPTRTHPWPEREDL